MAEEVNTAVNDNTNQPVADPKADSNQQAGTKPEQKSESAEQFDPSSLTDEQINNILTDDRVYKAERFRKLQEKAKNAEKLEKEFQKQEEEKLKADKKWEELATKLETEKNELLESVKTQAVNTAILTEATKLGIVDPEVATQLIDREKITQDDSGVSGVKEALEALIESKPYLKGKGATPSVGAGSNPSGQSEDGVKRYKLSQLQDSKFYLENQVDIDKAWRLGLIEDDVSKKS